MTDRLELVLADRDADYLKRLVEYIRETEWSRKLSVRQVTRPDMLKEALENRPAQLVALHADFDGADLAQSYVVRLCETRREADDSATGVPGVYKYQPLHQLLGRLTEAHRAYDGRVGGGTKSDSCSMISVFSAAGGVGKTTVSVHLARAFAEKGERCLYWNLELAPGRLFAKEADTEQAARFVYGLRTDAPWTTDCLAGLIFRAEPFGFDYFPGFRKVRETLEITGADVGKLAAFLRQSGRYDIVVFDLEATLHCRITGALKLSDAVVWLVTEDGESAARSFKLIADSDSDDRDRGFAALQDVRFVLNKHTGSSAQSLWTSGTLSSDTVPIAAKLPYISAWKQLHGGVGKQLAEPLFGESVAGLAALLLRAKGGESVVGRDDRAYAARAHS